MPAGVAVPGRLPATLAHRWRIKVGDGLASPVVAGGTVYYMDNVGGRETLHAVVAATGAERWQAAVDEAFKDSQSTAGPRCTPLTDGERVYAQSCRGELQCRDVRDGKLIWRTSYVTNHGAVFIGERGQAAGASRHGYNGSPVLLGDQLIALVGGTNGAAAVSFDKRTGAVRWRSGSDTAAYAPPVVMELAGRRQLVAFAVESLFGVDAEDGRSLWRVPFKTTFGRHVTTPVASGGVVAVSSHQFGLVGTRVEAGPGAAGIVATPLWTNRTAAINFASPVVVGGHLYGVGPAKDLVCVEMATGKLAWSRPGYFTSAPDKVHGAFLVLGSNVLVLTDGGELGMFAAEPGAFRELGRVQVCGVNWCNPAYAGGTLYLRDQRELMALALAVE